MAGGSWGRGLYSDWHCSTVRFRACMLSICHLRSTCGFFTVRDTLAVCYCTLSVRILALLALSLPVNTVWFSWVSAFIHSLYLCSTSPYQYLGIVLVESMFLVFSLSSPSSSVFLSRE